MAFKLPKLLKQKQRKEQQLQVTRIPGIPTFSYNDIVSHFDIGRGSFATVSVASDKTSVRKDLFVVKLMHNLEDDGQKIFIKEATLLNDCKHENIVALRGISLQPFALKMEYVYFDFKPFDVDLKVNSVKQFLSEFEGENWDKYFHLIPKIASDVTDGLLFLHGRDIVHRDLKTHNILISNQHYCDLQDEAAIQDMWIKCPLQCKLTDLGESRSHFIHTQSLVTTCTRYVDRGTPAYMAPEISLAEKQNIHDGSIQFLKKVDIWALGMIFYNLVNPNLSAPYKYDLVENKVPKENYVSCLRDMLRKQQLPRHVPMFKDLQDSEWKIVCDAMMSCVQFEPDKRSDVFGVKELLDNKQPSSTSVDDEDKSDNIGNDFAPPASTSEVPVCRNIPLAVSQSTALEQHDHLLAAGTIASSHSIPGDATNSCSFLSILIADHFLEERRKDDLPPLSVALDEWMAFAEDINNLILTMPSQFNKYRDINQLYDAYEAYQILRQANILKESYEFFEEIISFDKVYTQKGRDLLLKAVKGISESSVPKVAIYTCGKYIFVIGCRSGRLFVADSHTISPELGGNDCGILKVFFGKDIFFQREVCAWVWRRLKLSGVNGKASQSFIVLEHLISTAPDETQDQRTTEEKNYKNEIPTLNESETDSSEKADVSGHRKRSRTEKQHEEEQVEDLIRDDKRSEKADVSGHRKRSRTEKQHEEEQVEDFDDEVTTSDEGESDHSVVQLDCSDDVNSGDEGEPDTNESLSKRNGKSQTQTDEYWNDDQRIPLYEKGRGERLTIDEAITIITTTQVRKCTKQPLKVRENATFLVDLRWFSNWEDIKSDMNGVYSGVLRCGVWTVELENDSWSLIGRKKLPLTSPTMYHLIINSRKNKATPSLARSIFLLKDHNGKFVGNVCLLQYHVRNDAQRVEVHVQQHGNSRKSNPTPFYPLKKSSLHAIQEDVKTKPSRTVYESLRKNAGGLCGAMSLADLPRGKHQIYNAKSKAQQDSGDDVDDLLKYARDKEDLVLHHSDFPEDMWILGTSAMCRELVRCSTSELLSYPFSVDPTFSLGKFEVTPVVFKNVLLKSKRTGECPIFLGPTMIHHNKSAASYQTMAATCLRKCGGLEDAKGFITDGETALQKAFEEQLKNAKSLRCFKHFEGNCKDKLRQLGIRTVNDQKYFLDKTFGVRRKDEGILDATDGKDLRKRLKTSKEDLEKQEIQVLGKDNKYSPKYWSYLSNNKKMMKNHMVEKVRRKAGMIDGDDGKPPRCYTNCSESMNNVMKAARNNFLKQSGTSCLSKLEFTRHVFESIHDHHIQEMQAAVAGVSDEYELADCSKYLHVPADIWFEWSPDMRRNFMELMQKLSMKDIFQRKEVPWPSLDTNSKERPEFKDLEIDIEIMLTGNFNYSKDNATALKREVLSLVNNPRAIQPKASLTTERHPQFEVASQSSKNGCVLVTVYSNHVACPCGRYRHDGICKHSIAVAAHQSILPAHFDFLKKKYKKGGKGRTALAEHDVNKKTAGKKGARNKYSYRPERGSSRNEIPQESQTYTAIHHNDNPFDLMFLPKEAKVCKSCDTDFCHRTKIIPFDLVFGHKERWHYPVNGDWANRKASTKETMRYYHTTKKCILERFPYFNWDFVVLSQSVAVSLSESHRQYLKSEFHNVVF